MNKLKSIAASINSKKGYILPALALGLLVSIDPAAAQSTEVVVESFDDPLTVDESQKIINLIWALAGVLFSLLLSYGVIALVIAKGIAKKAISFVRGLLRF